MNSSIKIGTIILAAGPSSRLGQPKQLVNFQGKTLLENTIETVREVIPNNIVVVLGSDADHISQFTHGVRTILNENWERGMGSSLKSGLLNLNMETLDGFMVCVCDQPFLTSDHLLKMLEDFGENPEFIITSVYKGSLGVPVIFPKSFRELVLKIDDKKGAKSIVIHHPNATRKINLELGEVDIDTPEDLKFLNF